MGVCRFCGKPAGFFNHVHPACLTLHNKEVDEKKAEEKRCEELLNAAKKEIELASIAYVNSSEDAPTILKAVQEISSRVDLDPSECRDVILRSFNSYVVTTLENDLVTGAVSQKIMDLANLLELSRRDVFSNENYPMLKLAKNNVLLNFRNGHIPPYFDGAESTGMNIEPAEIVVWVFRKVRLYEERVHNHKVGGGAGISFKIYKGVYVHTGGFASHIVSNVEVDYVDEGTLVFTDKKIYFSGNHKGLKIAYKKIISFEKYPDGIEIIKDGTSAKPLYLVTGDAWFTYNLASQLANGVTQLPK